VSGARFVGLAAAFGLVLGSVAPAQSASSAFPAREFGLTLGKSQVQGGATPTTQNAVRAGLTWLARHQDADGNWSEHGCRDHCPKGNPCQPETQAAKDSLSGGSKFDVGLTSLALLAFLGTGLQPNSPQTLADDFAGKQYETGKDVILRGLEWLAKRQRKDGGFGDPAVSTFMYNDALAAAALAETFGMTRDDRWKAPAQRAIDYLCSAQKPRPKSGGKWGWRYDSAAEVLNWKADYPSEQAYLEELSDADVSITTWVAMAFKSARLSGLTVPSDACDGAVDFIRSATAPNGLVGYLSAEAAGMPIQNEHGSEFSYPATGMAAAAICARVSLERKVTPETFKPSADQIMKLLPSTGSSATDHRSSLRDYYYWYYGSMALDQLDGPGNPRATHKSWQKWNKAMQDAVLASQSTAPMQCATGGFLQPDMWTFDVGPVYSTAINVLTLETYYRYENAFAAGNKSAR
jgi:hypothetical protein